MASRKPVQIIHADRDAAGDIRSATVAFVAHDVPAMGWKIYNIVPLNDRPLAIFKGHGAMARPHVALVALGLDDPC